MTKQPSFMVMCLVTVLGPAALAWQKESVSAPAPDGSVVIESGRPLDEATRILADRYGVPITYEDPKWQWNEDLIIGKWITGDLPKFILPGGLYPEKTPTAESAAQKMVEADNSQNRQGLRFRVQKSRRGLHILPSQFHSASGDLVPATSILDVSVNVPAAERMASEHLRAICDAVGRITGVRLLIGAPLGGLDSLFAANGVIAPRDVILRPPEERKMYSFLWGSSGSNARDAISALLEGSATTLRWFLRCDPALMGDPRFCVLNLRPLMKRVTTEDGKLRPGSNWMVFDRAAKPPVRAPAIPAPAPAPAGKAK
jgi:hypothetical protein